MLRDEFHCYQIILLSIVISMFAFGNTAQAMLMPDCLDTAAQKRTRGLKEFASSSAKNAFPESNKWLEIPAWLAGSWCSNETIQVYPDKGSPKKKQAHVDLRLTAFSKIGTAKDSKGRI